MTTSGRSSMSVRAVVTTVQSPANFCTCFLKTARQRLDARDQMACHSRQQFAFVRQLAAATMRLKQLGFQLPFQGMHLLPHRWVRESERIGCCLETSQPRSFAKTSKLLKRDLFLLTIIHGNLGGG